MKFFSKDVPLDKTIIQHIKDNSDFLDVSERVKSEHIHYHNEFTPIAIDKDALKKLKFGVISAVSKYGLHGWLTAEGRKDDSPYGSFSMTHNPNHTDSAIDDPHTSGIGTSKLLTDNVFYGGSLSNMVALRNGYYDTYAFNVRTPATYEFGINEFTSAFKSTIVRSRTSAIRPNYQYAESFEFGWHRDESMFENMRIVIPIQTDETYLMQMDTDLDVAKEDSTTTLTAHAKYGHAIMFDSHKPHRAFRSGESSLLRIHTIYGISPWIDYLPEEDAWVFNDHYGKTHPIDMLKQSLITPFIGDIHES